MTKVTFIILECFRQISSLFSLKIFLWYDTIRSDKTCLWHSSISLFERIQETISIRRWLAVLTLDRKSFDRKILFKTSWLFVFWFFSRVLRWNTWQGGQSPVLCKQAQCGWTSRTLTSADLHDCTCLCDWKSWRNISVVCFGGYYFMAFALLCGFKDISAVTELETGTGNDKISTYITMLFS